MQKPDYNTRLLRATRHAQTRHCTLMIRKSYATLAYVGGGRHERKKLRQRRERLDLQTFVAGKRFWRLVDVVAEQVCNGRVDLARQMVERIAADAQATQQNFSFNFTQKAA